MQIFVNECSIHEQFYEQTRFEFALRQFFSVLNSLNKARTETRLYQVHDFRFYKAVYGEFLVSSLNNIRDKSLKVAVNNILSNKLNALDWMKDRVHSPDDIFECDDELVTDTSMAEVAERLQSGITELGLLINFPQSKFDGMTSLTINKNEETSTIVDCVNQRIEFESWLESNFPLSQNEYEHDSDIPPRDAQTLLIDRIRFVRTTLPKQGGRTVFQEIQTRYYWYVDSFHFGNAAHLEVFDSIGNHIGESNLNGVLDKNKADDRKKLNL